MRTACGDQAVAVIPIKALRLGLSPRSFRVLAELFTARETEGFRCVTFNELDLKCFLPLTNHTEKALAELERCGITTILKRVDEGFSFRINREDQWRLVERGKAKESTPQG
jgi:hypothetical protein